MTPPDDTLVQYESGSDVTLGYGRFHFQFNLADFSSRVHAAAVALGFVTPGPRNDGERTDLVTLAVHGEIVAPQSALGVHLAARRDALVDSDGGVVHWLRRLVFRDAWVDQQIKEGRIDPHFDEVRGFQYRSAATGEPLADPARLPDWSRFRFGTLA